MEELVKESIISLAEFMEKRLIFDEPGDVKGRKERREPEILDIHNNKDHGLNETIAIIDDRVSTTNGLIDREEVKELLVGNYSDPTVEAVLDKLEGFGALK